jgi:hypothetical protein
VAATWTVLLVASGANSTIAALAGGFSTPPIVLLMGALLTGLAWLAAPPLAFAIVLPIAEPLLEKATTPPALSVTVVGLSGLVGLLLRTPAASETWHAPVALPAPARWSAIGVAIVSILVMPWLY